MSMIADEVAFDNLTKRTGVYEMKMGDAPRMNPLGQAQQDAFNVDEAASFILSLSRQIHEILLGPTPPEPTNNDQGPVIPTKDNGVFGDISSKCSKAIDSLSVSNTILTELVEMHVPRD